MFLPGNNYFSCEQNTKIYDSIVHVCDVTIQHSTTHNMVETTPLYMCLDVEKIEAERPAQPNGSPAIRMAVKIEAVVEVILLS